MKIIITESQLKKLIKNNLNENFFDFHSMNYDDQKKIYNIFKDSYEKSVGVSWTEDKFFNRSRNWKFYGDENGFISIRPQNSGFYKLVGVAGSLKGILKGLDYLNNQDYPIWGMVSEDIKNMALRKGFKEPSKSELTMLYNNIPSSVFGGVETEVNTDGSLTLKYPDVVDTKKYFIANEKYFDKMKNLKY